MPLLEEKVPDFTAQTTEGEIQFYKYTGNSWSILMSHPGVSTPVCTTELAKLIEKMPEFTKRNMKVLALSYGNIEESKEWSKDILSQSSNPPAKLPYPIISDNNKELALLFEFIRKEDKDKKGLLLTARQVLIMDPDKKLKACVIYPATAGRNLNEILRLVDCLQYTAKTGNSCPADWQVGGKILIPESKSAEEAEKYATNIQTVPLPSGKKYLRTGTPK